MFDIEFDHILLLTFLFMTTLNCLVTYFCSSSSLNTLTKTKSYSKAIKQIVNYDRYLLTILIWSTSLLYVVLSYQYFKNLLEISDYFIALSLMLGFVLSLATTFLARLCYCYACNVLLKTTLSAKQCFMENFFSLIKVFFPIFLISFIIPTIYILPFSMTIRDVIAVIFMIVYLIVWILSESLMTILTLEARKIENESLLKILDNLFIKNGVTKYRLYYWDSSKSNEDNALICGIFIKYVFISTTLLEKLTKREIEAIILHEIGHVKNNHVLKGLILKLASLILVTFMVYVYMIEGSINILILLLVIVLFVLIMGMNLHEIRKHEDEADLFVNSKGYGKDLISALKKIDIENMDERKVDELLSTHKSMEKRIDGLDNNILCIAFKEAGNSAYKFVRKLKNDKYDKLYLKRDYLTAPDKFNEINKDYDVILIFDQKDEQKKAVNIRKKAKSKEEITSTLNLDELKHKLKNDTYDIVIKDEIKRGFINDFYCQVLKKNPNSILILLPNIEKINDMEFFIDLVDKLY